jgi:sec-independent protein translocase protein TatC
LWPLLFPSTPHLPSTFACSVSVGFYAELSDIQVICMLWRSGPRPDYGEDFFAETRMSFGEHIEDLRSHLIRALKWFCVGMVFGFIIGKPVLGQITQPVEDAVKRYYETRRQEEGRGTEDPVHPLNKNPIELLIEVPAQEVLDGLKKVQPNIQWPAVSENTPPLDLRLKLKNPALLARELIPLSKKMGHEDTLKALSATEAFVVWMLVSLIVGLVISSPMVIYEIWAFVATGLYPHEKQYVYFLLPFSIGLFLVGVLVCQLFIMPAALDALLSFNAWLQIDPDIRLREWLSFAIIMPVITGLCFETPLVMMFLGLIGIMTAKDFMQYWRIAIFIMLVVAAVISPSIDPVSLFILWVPMCCLYFLGIYLVKRVERPRTPRAENPESYVDEVPYDPDMLK